MPSVLFFQRQGYALSLFIDFQDPNLHLLPNLDYLGGVFDVTVCQLTDVDETVLVHPYIGEGPEFGDIGDDRRQQHAGLQVFDAVYPFSKLERGKGLPGIAAGFGWLIRSATSLESRMLTARCSSLNA